MSGRRLFLCGMASSVVALTACADEPAAVVAKNKPEDALRGFYTALLRDQDHETACRFASPRFHLRPSNIVGASVNEDDADTQLPPNKSSQPAPRHEPCPRLTRRIFAARGDMYPFSAWSIDSVKVSENGRTAEAVTMDGSAGLEVVDDAWRVVWAFDAPPA